MADQLITWTNDELNRIGGAEEIQIAPLLGDGTLREPVTIWIVRLGKELYVRCASGRGGAWFRAAKVRHEGRIWAGGVEKDVTFVQETDPEVNNKIDAAYLSKYQSYPQYVAPMVTDEVRAATLKLVPRV
jgi:hypothetical protein